MPFQNASLHLPELAEVVCKPSIRAVVQNLDSTENYTSIESINVSYTIEIKEGFLPPWIISRI